MESALSYFTKLFTEHFSSLPDKRVGKNSFIKMQDIALSAFSVFFTQSSSFLEHQRLMQSRDGQNNARSLFQIEHIPTDNHIRTMLDDVPPTELFSLFDKGLNYLNDRGVLETFRHVDDTFLLPLDGVQYYSSKKISCNKCSQKKHSKNNRITYSHTMVSATLVHPNRKEVLPLIPSYVEPQDGHEKQDCERAAASRWLKTVGPHYAKLGVTLLGDDLYCCEPIGRLALKQGFHFIFVCKPESHKTLYEWIDSLEKAGTLNEFERVTGTSRNQQTWKFRYVNDVPIKDGKEALHVNWCEIEAFNSLGERVYFNTFVTDHLISDSNVTNIVCGGRTRWKTENEHNNTLKNHGYHLEHNFGHGKKHLSSTLATLILLALLLHTILEFTDKQYHAIRGYLPRAQFFNQLKTLLMYMYFATWEALMSFMEAGSKPVPRRRKRKDSG